MCPACFRAGLHLECGVNQGLSRVLGRNHFTSNTKAGPCDNRISTVPPRDRPLSSSTTTFPIPLNVFVPLEYMNLFALIFPPSNTKIGRFVVAGAKESDIFHRVSGLVPPAKQYGFLGRACRCVISQTRLPGISLTEV